MKRAFFIFLLLQTGLLYAQRSPTDFKRVLTIHTDNDAFVAWENRDRYYTYGLGGSLSFKAKNLLGLQDWFSQREHYFFRAGLRIEGYTPTNKVVSEEQLQGDSLVVFDRPFAGLLYGTLESTFTFKRSFFTAGVLVGIMGPSSGAGRLQRWIHDNVTQDGVFDAWRFQLPDQLIFNLSGKYLYDFTPANTWFDVYGEAEGRLGNLYIDASPRLGFRIGRFNPVQKSVALGNGILSNTSDWELYLHSRFSATLALFNGTAQGRLFGPTFEYALEDINPFYLAMSHGIYIAYKRVVFGYDLDFRYGEVVERQRHIYGRFEFKYRF